MDDNKQTEHRGRKKLSNPRKKSTITLPGHWWDWLNSRPLSQSMEIEAALVQYRVGIEDHVSIDIGGG